MRKSTACISLACGLLTAISQAAEPAPGALGRVGHGPAQPPPASLPLAAVSNAVASASKLPHPRLLADAAAFEALRAAVRTNELARIGFERIRYDADQILSAPPSERIKVGRRLLSISREVLYRITTLAMTYRLTSDARYRDRAAKELLAVSAFSDWNPSHFLDVAEMTLAVSIGYDWLYNDLDPATRATVAAALLDKGLVTSLRSTGWVKASNNWGQVCHGGMLAGALALMDTTNAPAVEIIHRSITHLPHPMKAIAPNGCYPEGPGYWAYGVDFNVVAIALLENVFHTDFGLTSLPGFKATSQYLDLVTGPSGLTFNYADGGSGRGTDCATWWFAKRFDSPDLLPYFELAAYHSYCAERPKSLSAKAGRERLFALTLFWLPPAGTQIPATPRAPLIWNPGGPIPIVIQRSSWDNSTAWFVGLKAGSPSGPHGHMDCGSFVLDAAGIRWAVDIGAESYNKIEQLGMNLWDAKQGSDRWRIFRLSSFAHNVPMIDGSQQLASATARVVSVSEAPSRAVLDLSALYTNATSVIRAGELLPAGYRLTDTFAGLRPGANVRWAMMTRSSVQPVDSTHLLLREGGKSLRLTTATPVEWKIEASPAPNTWDSPNKGASQITFTIPAPASGALTNSVEFAFP